MILLVDIERRERELRFVLEQSSELEVVLRVEGALHGHIVLEKFKEFLFECVNFLGNEERVDVREISV